ncbi:ribosome biogenesis protein SLX9 homolog [Patella vulgata]|uniref:ribosome biogenesis protein SLX9 homolog n=1 Tax=Patella vulgata TaxID=6465 RepID=UPI00217FDAFF|nr:ribosome biogenesis protein SLX9 homolog [Patella vulgata]
MGKVKKIRLKLHNASAKSKINVDNKTKEEINLPNEIPSLIPVDSKNMVISANLFSGMNIDKTNLTQRLPDFDARSAITSKTLKGLSMKKKDKLKLRREYFMQKINAIEVNKKKAKEKKKRMKTAIVGDMSVIEDALPTLDLLMKTSTSKDSVPHVPKNRCVQKAKNRVKKGLNNMKMFKQVLKHPAFRNDPGSTINEHLHNKMKQEEQ